MEDRAVVKRDDAEFVVNLSDLAALEDAREVTAGRVVLDECSLD